MSDQSRSEVQAIANSLLSSDSVAIVNLSLSRGSFSAKFEFPQVSLVETERVLRLDNQEERLAFQSTGQLIDALSDEPRVNYFGVRYFSGKAREVTFYVNARNAVDRMPSLAP